jgi:hypothetical protein
MTATTKKPVEEMTTLEILDEIGVLLSRVKAELGVKP